MPEKIISLVVPLYNEEAGIGKIVPELIAALRQGGFAFELVLVDNGSRDKTPVLLEALAKENPQIKVVHVDVNQGYGWGVTRGLAQAAGDIVGFVCGDGQTDPGDIAAISREALAGRGDIVKARRISRGDGLIRWLNSKIYNVLFRLLFRVLTPDVNGTPKYFSKEIFQTLNLMSKDWFIDAEIMIKASRRHLRIVEIPVHYHRRVAGRSNVSLRAVWEFLRNMGQYRFGKKAMS